jgi:hypothetical protein
VIVGQVVESVDVGRENVGQESVSVIVGQEVVLGSVGQVDPLDCVAVTVIVVVDAEMLL